MKEVFKGLKKYGWRIFAVVFLTFLNALGELFLPKLMSVIVDQGVAYGDIDFILKIGGRMVVVAVLTVIVRTSAAYNSSKVTMAFSRDIRHKIFTKVNHMTFDEIEDFGISSLITRTTDDVARVEQTTLMWLRPMVRAPLMFIVSLIMALTTNLKLSLIIFATIPFSIAGIYYIIKVGLPHFPKIQKALDKINLLIRQRLTGLKVIRAFGRDEYEEEIFNDANDKYSSILMKVSKILIAVEPVLSIILNFALILVFYFGAKLINIQQMGIGDLMAYLQYIEKVLTAVLLIGNLMRMIPQTITSAERIAEILAFQSHETGGDIELSDSIKSIEANNLTFYYPDSKKPSLKNINFKLNAGESLGIIGGTGSGKSTLLKLIMQFYSPSSGELLINDIDIKSLKTHDLRREISYVPQTNFFFTKTVGENLAYSNEDISEKEILTNLEIAQARGFLSDQAPLNEEMSRGGLNYSGGQRQRLAIARALNRNASVFIFDDSFSALDYKTDLKVRQGLSDKLANEILIIVGQRVATIRSCDKIIVLENGELVGFGSHDELLKTNLVYKEIAISQGEELSDE